MVYLSNSEDDPVMLRKLERIGAECIAITGNGKRYRLHRSQVVIRRRSVVSEKQRVTRLANFGNSQ